MSAPPGFNPNASLLPDPGPSAAPIQVMKGGGAKKAQKGGVFTADQEAQLAKYQLHTGGVIADKFNEAQKEEFLKQVANTSRCRRTTGDSVILGKDCDMVVKVIRELLNAKIKKGNIQAPVEPAVAPAPGAPAASTSTGEPAAPSGEPAAPSGEPAAPAAPSGEPAAPSGEPAAPSGEPAAPSGEPAAPSGEPAAPSGEPAAPSGEPAAENENNNNSSSLGNDIPNNLEISLTGNRTEKPSPCKNRGKTQRNNNNNVGSVAESVREALDTPRTLGALDEWVRVHYPELIGNKEIIEDTEADYFKPLTEGEHYEEINNQMKEDKWTAIRTIGDSHCLVHALLTSTSPSYRKIPYDNRSAVGTAYRHDELYKLFNPVDQAFVKGRDFLEEKHLQKIADVFHINIFTVVHHMTRKTTMYGITNSELNRNNTYPWIFLYNTLNGHYSAVQIKKRNTFIMSSEDVKTVYGSTFGNIAATENIYDTFTQLKVGIKNELLKLKPKALQNTNKKENIEGELIKFELEDLDSVEEMIRSILKTYGKTEKTEEILGKFKDRLAALQARVPKKGGRAYKKTRKNRNKKSQKV